MLFVDTFNRYFEPGNARAAMTVLQAAGYRVHAPAGLCCGRTFLAVGRERALAAMIRAGHGFALAKAIVDRRPGDFLDNEELENLS